MSREKKLLIGNVFNKLMINHWVPEHSEHLRNASARKIWLADEGDVVATQRTVSPDLRTHFQRIIGIDTNEIKFLLIGQNPLAIMQQIDSEFMATRAVLVPYALEPWVVQISDRLGLPVECFDGRPSDAIVEFVDTLNTKSTFRSIAPSLGLTIPDGCTSDGLADLLFSCRQMLEQHNKIIVKLDRSSNGFGNIVFSSKDIPTLKDTLTSFYFKFQEQSGRFVIEEFLDFNAVPSIEMTVEQAGPRINYISDQRSLPQAGLATPPPGLAEFAVSNLKRTADIVGRWLHERGYRGIFDVDGGCTSDQKMYFTEINVRRTAGSHLHDIATRLLHDPNNIRLSGSFELSQRTRLSKLEAIADANGLLFNHKSRTGAIFPVDHITDEICYFQVFASNLNEALELKHNLQQKLGARLKLDQS